MKLLALFRRLWFVSLLGVLALALIVWFEGPLVAFNGHAPLESVPARAYLILLVLLSWAGWLGWRALRARRANAELLKGLAAAETMPVDDGGIGAQSAEERRALTERFDQALQVLKKAKLGGRFGQQYLYQLPWYMIVGAPGAGKTTALVNSGLRFPLTEALGTGSVRGVGGTRDCDWWFTDEAVLLDTAGRFTTQDSQREVDRAGWSAFLGLLKTYRRRQPVNGAILAISVADLLAQDAQARQAQATQIRARLQELYSELGLRCPIYVVVTKLDLLAGFTQFFDGLGETERTQVWGFTFAVDPDRKIAENPLAGFGAEYAALEGRLNGLLLDRVQDERDQTRRALIYGFPQQFAALRPVLEGFLADAFAATRFEQKAWVRGVYFTSGTQEGNPIDRVIGALSAAFGLRRQLPPLQAGRGRSYFLNRLLKDVIFQEAGLSGGNPREERRRLWLQRAAFAGAAVLLVLFGALFAISYGRNQSYVAEVEQQTRAARALAAALTPQQSGVLDALPLLDAVRAIPGGYGDLDKGTPWLSGFGLYQGDKLGTEAQEDYHRLLNEALLPRLKHRIEGQLRAASNKPEYQYEGLRVYLMLRDPAHFDPAAISAWLTFDAEHQLAAQSTADQRVALAGHEAALLDRKYFDFGAPLDQDVIDATRRDIARLPLAQRAYSRLLNELGRAAPADFSVVAGGGRDAPSVLLRRSGAALSKGVPGIYSAAGYKKFLASSATAAADLSKDSWVIGADNLQSDAPALEKLNAAVLQLYYDDYIRRWDDFLADVGVVSFTNPDQGSRILGLLAGPDSPLKKLLVAAARETTLVGVAPPKSVTDTVKGKLEDYTHRLENVLGSDAPAAGGGPVATPVDLHFEALHHLVDGAGASGGAPIDQTLAELADTKAFLDAAASAKQSGQPPPKTDAIDKLARGAKASGPPIVADALRDIANSASASTLGGERQRLNALWTANVLPLCQQAVNGRYPIFPKGAEEIPQQDFGRIFAPGGLLDDFYQKNLAAYVDSSGPRWRWRAVGNVSLGIPDEVLTDLQRAVAIRDAFFRGGSTPAIRFELKPVSFDKGLTQFNLDIDGQVIALTPTSPVRPVTVQWPGAGATSTIHVEYAPASASGNGYTLQGAWALFRLLDRNTLTRSPQRERFTLTFDLDGRKVVLELLASSVLNPFQLDALTQFRCPARL